MKKVGMIVLLLWAFVSGLELPEDEKTQFIFRFEDHQGAGYEGNGCDTIFHHEELPCSTLEFWSSVKHGTIIRFHAIYISAIGIGIGFEKVEIKSVKKDGKYSLEVYSSNRLHHFADFSPREWNYFAIKKQGTNLYYFVNGTMNKVRFLDDDMTLDIIGLIDIYPGVDEVRTSVGHRTEAELLRYWNKAQATQLRSSIRNTYFPLNSSPSMFYSLNGRRTIRGRVLTRPGTVSIKLR